VPTVRRGSEGAGVAAGSRIVRPERGSRRAAAGSECLDGPYGRDFFPKLWLTGNPLPINTHWVRNKRFSGEPTAARGRDVTSRSLGN